MGISQSRRNELSREEVQTKPRGRSLTKQSPRDLVDINAIVAKHSATGQLPQVIAENPRFGEFQNVTDYRDMLDRVRQAQENFMALPANIRRRVDHDAGQFIDFVYDPANAEELEELGLKELAEALHGPRPTPPSPPSPPSAPSPIAGSDGEGGEPE